MAPAGSSRETATTSRPVPFVALAIKHLSARSCLIDGEAIVCDDDGLASFDLLRRCRANAAAVLCAFDLLALNGDDLRGLPIEKRKRALAKLLRGAHAGIVFNEHYEAEGPIVYRKACRLGCEGIVSKRGRGQLLAHVSQSSTQHLMANERRFPPPWSIEDNGSCFRPLTRRALPLC